MSYLNVDEIASGIAALAKAYPAQADEILMPHSSVEGREIPAIALGDIRQSDRPTLLLVGGLHAREWVPPDALLFLAADLLEAKNKGTGLRYGTAFFDAAAVRRIFKNLQIVILPCANPDGRHFSQTTDTLWRKNRSINANTGTGVCHGVDLNRNFDVAWEFRRTFADNSVSASDDPCDRNLYVGPSAQSEPETRNVVWLFDTYSDSRWYIDVHSAIPAVFHGWGLDENQSTQSDMNFLNPQYDGVRGIPGDGYQEFMNQADATEVKRLAKLMADKIELVHGDRYEVGQAFSLYATSGASDDYAYSRHRQDLSKGKVLGFTMECGHEFQPVFDEAVRAMEEVAAALTGMAEDLSDNLLSA